MFSFHRLTMPPEPPTPPPALLSPGGAIALIQGDIILSIILHYPVESYRLNSHTDRIMDMIMDMIMDRMM